MTLLDIKTAPQDRVVMVVDVVGRHCEAHWARVNHEKIVAWEGWCYTDPLLADYFPEGPTDPKYWYERPGVEPTLKPTRSASAQNPLDQDSQDIEAWHLWADSFYRDSSDFNRFPGTVLQALAIDRIVKESQRDIRFACFEKRAYDDRPKISAMAVQDHTYSTEISVQVKHAYAPVIRENGYFIRVEIDGWLTDLPQHYHS